MLDSKQEKIVWSGDKSRCHIFCINGACIKVNQRSLLCSTSLNPMRLSHNQCNKREIMIVFKKRWCGLHSAIFPIYQFSFLKPVVWEATGGNNQLLTKAACGQAAGAISGRSLIRTHCIPPFSFPLYPAVFHTLTLIIPHCMYTFYIFSYTLILFSHYSGFY